MTFLQVALFGGLLLWTAAVKSQKTLFIIGSVSDNNAEIWDAFVDLAGGDGIARIGVVTAASFDPLDSAVYYRDMFTSHGAAEVYWIPVYEDNTVANSDPTVIQNIERMTGIFFGGGDQMRIITSFYINDTESPALVTIKQMHAGGAVVGGTSAGSACMGSAVMITGGMSYNALRKGAKEYGAVILPDDLTYYGAGGIGVMNGYIVDTHFSERGREGRLIRLLSDTKDLTNGVLRGFGVDEDTALIITDVDTATASGKVIGRAGVMFADIGNSQVTNATNWGITNVITHYVTAGDVVDMTTLKVTFAGYKSDMNGQEQSLQATTSNNIFLGNRDEPIQLPEYEYVVTELFNSVQNTTTWGDTEEQRPMFRLWFYKTGATAYGGINPDLVNDKFQISYINTRVDIEEYSLSENIMTVLSTI